MIRPGDTPVASQPSGRGLTASALLVEPSAYGEGTGVRRSVVPVLGGAIRLEDFSGCSGPRDALGHQVLRSIAGTTITFSMPGVVLGLGLPQETARGWVLLQFLNHQAHSSWLVRAGWAF